MLEWLHRKGRPSRVGVALGGGGAKGLAHLLMLETLDELGLRPAMVAGTSIGAVVGALYCAGVSPALLRRELTEMSLSNNGVLETFRSGREVLRWLDFFRPQLSASGLLKAERFLQYLTDHTPVRHFEELEVPLKVVAADFYRREQVVFDTGPLLSAVAASMALPGVFPPVVRDGRVLVDGGAVNPVPYDLLKPHCDLVIAIDVMGRRSESETKVPSIADAILNTFQIMERSITREKLRAVPVDIYIEPEIADIRALEFYKAEDIFRQAAPACEDLRRALTQRFHLAAE